MVWDKKYKNKYLNALGICYRTPNKFIQLWYNVSFYKTFLFTTEHSGFFMYIKQNSLPPPQFYF